MTGFQLLYTLLLQWDQGRGELNRFYGRLIGANVPVEVGAGKGEYQGVFGVSRGVAFTEG